MTYTVVDYVPPFLKDFIIEKKGKGSKLVVLRYMGDKQFVLPAGKEIILPTGIILRKEIEASRLKIEEKSKAWEDGVTFELMEYKIDKPLKVKVINNSLIKLHLFPQHLLTNLIVEEMLL